MKRQTLGLKPEYALYKRLQPRIDAGEFDNAIKFYKELKEEFRISGHPSKRGWGAEGLVKALFIVALAEWENAIREGKIKREVG